jgi:hypothetical protein
MSGLAINLSFHPHVQSFLYALDREGLEIIKDHVYDCGIYNKDMSETGRWNLIKRYEIGMGRAILQAGYRLSALVGAMGPFTIGQSDIDSIKADVGEQASKDALVLGLHKEDNIWTDASSPYILPWGDDLWNPHALRMIGNDTSPLWSDIVFFKASRGYMLPGMEEIGYEDLDFFGSIDALQDLSSTSSSVNTNICETAKTNFREASGLSVIVTGMMHSGTSILSQLIMSAPDVFGGVEWGLLMAKKPSEFADVHPFYEWMIRDDAEGLWALSESSRDLIVNARCDAEMYATLRQRSPLYHYGYNLNSTILDKTPGYMSRLVEVMDRTPGIPVVVTQKNDADMAKALEKRYANDPKTMFEVKRLVQNNREQLKLAQEKYPGRIHIANTSDWHDKPNEIMEGVFDFLGLKWKPEYLTMDAVNAKRVQGSVKTAPFTRKKNEGISVVYQAEE